MLLAKEPFQNAFFCDNPKILNNPQCETILNRIGKGLVGEWFSFFFLKVLRICFLLFLIKLFYFLFQRKEKVCPGRLARSRTSAFQADNTGSNPVQGIVINLTA